ncbi:fumarylacetoacetate hydrolase family protein [Kineosporia rhizophila]|uniref:fumarylacetoacetate hydrolase family protein n=1 Tax=Kineosporia rhizophila TaxID=84633 RepID=UPI001E3C1ED7|nr:fumarylacetoacetate hydrolase family protein [Kineosporia rhizophila]MCE0537578.1 fumarylacetoacetate hydrolase family protein [Kineosporia rhizophila]
MRFASWISAGVTKAGVVGDHGLHAFDPGVSVLDVVRSGLPTALRLGEQTLHRPAEPLERARLLPPLQPPSVRDFVAFEEHVEGVVRSVGGSDGTAVVPEEWYQAPTFYFTNPYALIGAEDDVAVPPGCSLLDFELEVAAVLGVSGSSLSVPQAREAIFGYTVMNDWSARDLQRREMRVNLGPAKGKDFATTLGPWLVTADEFEDRTDSEGFLNLKMQVWVNDELVGEDLLANMGWPFAELVAYASRGSQVCAGDVLGSGTSGNGGCLAELWGRRGAQEPAPLKPGDLVRMSVEGIGTIANRVVPGISLPPIAPARPRPRNRR